MQDWVREYYDSAVIGECGRLRHDRQFENLAVEELLTLAFARVHASDLDEIVASQSAPLEFARMTFVFDEPEPSAESEGG